MWCTVKICSLGHSLMRCCPYIVVADHRGRRPDHQSVDSRVRHMLSLQQGVQLCPVFALRRMRSARTGAGDALHVDGGTRPSLRVSRSLRQLDEQRTTLRVLHRSRFRPIVIGLLQCFLFWFSPRVIPVGAVAQWLGRRHSATDSPILAWSMVDMLPLRG